MKTVTSLPKRLIKLDDKLVQVYCVLDDYACGKPVSKKRLLAAVARVAFVRCGLVELSSGLDKDSN